MVQNPILFISDVSDSRCPMLEGVRTARHIHLWWSCPKIRTFWEAITPWIKKDISQTHRELSFALSFPWGADLLRVI